MRLLTKWQPTEGRVSDAIKRFSGVVPGYILLFSYRVGTKRYTGKYLVIRRFGAGNTLKISYDPKNPKRIRSVERQKWMTWLFVLGVIAGMMLWFHHLEKGH